MSNRRNEEFDRHRNMAELEELQLQIQQLQAVVQNQEAIIRHQEQQANARAPVEAQCEALQLSPQHILNQFRGIKPFDENHKLPAFIRSVENTARLCRDNELLYQFGLQIIINDKITGKAASYVAQLGENPSWNDVKEKLYQQFQPTKTYSGIFNNCREIKVSNLKELFDFFFNASFEINEIYQFDINKPLLYTAECVDRDLTEILLEKIDGPFRAYIYNENSLKNIYKKYANLKLLDDPRAINFHHRQQKQNLIKNNHTQNKNSQSSLNYYKKEANKPNNTGSSNQNQNLTIQNDSSQPRQSNNDSKQIRQLNNDRQPRQYYNNPRQPTTTNNNTRQTRPVNNESRQTRQSNQSSNNEMMEIDNIQESEIVTEEENQDIEDVNFQEEQEDSAYQ